VDILSSNGIGFALWNFRGDFGILDSGRTDVAYEDWYGHQLDRRLLDLIRKA
jgi:endoglucanase